MYFFVSITFHSSFPCLLGIIKAETYPSHYNPTKNEDALNRYVEQTQRCYGVLNGQLEKTNGESVLPGGVSAVDAHFEPWVRQHAFAQVPLDEFPLVQKWLEKMKGLEEVKRAYERIGEAAKA